MGALDGLSELLHELWKQASQVLEYELGVKWIESIYEDEKINDEEKVIEARIKFLRISVDVCKKVKHIERKLEKDELNENIKHKRKKRDVKRSGESKGNNI